ncbi:prepilin-type N-terminal cleavage/methylation domain-containing protein [Hippea alviniae]|uniref:prepilin-type N-terminal cleavage/methylation domain-containing protein n=1 Tax=Hippea alviniae TaxID=1279027 RepID=UPI0003B7AA32|nr:prepilin-type N-terminal cleavage/methylation domain-containing protein [Hippea alviniae]
MNNKGFSLIELIVVIVIISILLSIAVPMYSSWVKRQGIAKDTKKIFSELNYLRLKAFTTKDEYSLCWENNPFKVVYIKKNGNKEGSLSLKYEFVGDIGLGYNCVDFSPDGTADHTGNIRINDVNSKASIDCVDVSRFRISLGKWSEGECKNY